jgi:hypothetical protein
MDQSLLEQGGIDFNNGSDQSLTMRLRSGFTSIKASTKYTLAFSTTNNLRIRAIVYYNASKGWVSTSQYGTNTTEETFTTPSSVSYLRVVLQNTSSGTVVPSEVTNLQLEKGSYASSYVPYTMDNVELTERSKGKKIYFTPTNCTANSGYDSCYYYKEGDIVHLHMGCQSPTSKNTTYEMSGLPVGYRPKAYVAACGWASDTGATIVPVWVWVRNNGVISFNTQGNYFIVDLSFLAES